MGAPLGNRNAAGSRGGKGKVSKSVAAYRRKNARQKNAYLKSKGLFMTKHQKANRAKLGGRKRAALNNRYRGK